MYYIKCIIAFNCGAHYGTKVVDSSEVTYFTAEFKHQHVVVILGYYLSHVFQRNLFFFFFPCLAGGFPEEVLFSEFPFKSSFLGFK